MSQNRIIEIPQVQCFICGNYQCEQENDHKKMVSYHFYQLLREKAGFSSEISFLKMKIQKAFQKLKGRTSENLQPYESKLYLLTDTLHFWDILQHESSLRSIELAIFGYMLPRNQLIKLIASLQKCTNKLFTFPSFKQLLGEVHNFKRNSKNIIQNNDYDSLYRALKAIISQCQREQVQKRLRNTRNRKEEAENDTIQIVTIQGVPFSTRRTQIDISVLQVRDKQVLKYLSALQKMKDLEQLSIGNNLLSKRSYRILFNTVKTISCLDLRNSSSENFVIPLCQRLPQLKALYCNETNMDDEKLTLIINSLSQLRVLYIDDNKISGEKLEEIVRNFTNIHYISAKRVQMPFQCAQYIRDVLMERGGYFWN